MTTTVDDFPPGQHVWINRDEKKYPSQGSWPNYRHRKGWVICHQDGEVGISWVRLTEARNPAVDTWFLPRELVAID